MYSKSVEHTAIYSNWMNDFEHLPIFIYLFICSLLWQSSGTLICLWFFVSFIFFRRLFSSSLRDTYFKSFRIFWFRSAQKMQLKQTSVATTRQCCFFYVFTWLSLVFDASNLTLSFGFVWTKSRILSFFCQKNLASSFVSFAITINKWFFSELI